MSDSTPRGRAPRVAPEASERTVMVRMPGSVHARLCQQREASHVSMNRFILAAILRSLPSPIVAAPDDAQVDQSSTNTQP